MQVANERNQRRRSARRKIRDELSKGPKTVPELATACDLPTNEVLWHVAGMRKYGELVEDVQAGDYFKYRLLVRDPGEGRPGEGRRGVADGASHRLHRAPRNEAFWGFRHRRLFQLRQLHGRLPSLTGERCLPAAG